MSSKPHKLNKKHCLLESIRIQQGPKRKEEPNELT